MFTRSALNLQTYPQAIPTEAGKSVPEELKFLREQVNALRKEHYEFMRSMKEWAEGLNKPGSIGIWLHDLNGLKGVVSATDYGCKGDGVTDDTTAMTAALARATYLLLPAGTFVIDDFTIPSSVKGIFGQGTHATTLYFRRKAYSASQVLVNTGATTGLLMRGVKVDTDSAEFQSAGVRVVGMHGAVDLHLQDIWIKGRGAVGFYTQSLTRANLKNLVIECTGGDGAANTFTTCFYAESATDAVVEMRTQGTLPAYGGALAASCIYSRFVNSHCHGTIGGFGFYMAGCESCGIIQCTAANTQFEAFQITSASHCEISGCMAQWDASSGNDFAISINGDVGAVATNNLVANNVLKNSYKAGLAAANNAKWNLFHGNVLRDCGVRDTVNDSVMQSYTDIAAATCVHNTYRANQIITESGNVAYGYSEFNSGGGGSTLTNTNFIDNEWRGAGTYTTGKYLFVDVATLVLSEFKTGRTLDLTGTTTTPATMTFPSTSATIARTDAGQTFTGTNNFAAITATDVTTTGNTILGNAQADTLNVGNGDIVKDANGLTGFGVTPSAGRGKVQVGSTTADAVATAFFGNWNIVSDTTVGYPAIGYNITSGNAANTWRYLGADNVSWIQFNANAFNFYNNTGAPAAGGLITKQLAFTVNGSGAGTFLSSASATALIPTGSTVPVNGMYLSGTNEVSWATNSAKQLTLTSDGRFYGISLHNNAGAVTGTTNQYIASGTYTPTLTNVANVAASTMRLTQWIRVGNVVHVAGNMDIDPTAAAPTTTSFDITLPIASALANDFQLGGAGLFSSIPGNPVQIIGEIGGDKARFSFQASTAANDKLCFTFTYVVV